jgi:hypothetical protein
MSRSAVLFSAVVLGLARLPNKQSPAILAYSRRFRDTRATRRDVWMLWRLVSGPDARLLEIVLSNVLKANRSSCRGHFLS